MCITSIYNQERSNMACTTRTRRPSVSAFSFLLLIPPSTNASPTLLVSLGSYILFSPTVQVSHDDVIRCLHSPVHLGPPPVIRHAFSTAAPPLPAYSSGAESSLFTLRRRRPSLETAPPPPMTLSDCQQRLTITQCLKASRF
jgi:hypothetical protein